MAQVMISQHPLVRHKLTLLRRATTEPKKFRELVRELSQFLLYEATSRSGFVLINGRFGCVSRVIFLIN